MRAARTLPRASGWFARSRALSASQSVTFSARYLRMHWRNDATIAVRSAAETKAPAPNNLALSPGSLRSNHVPSATRYHPIAAGSASAQNANSTRTYANVPAFPKDLTFSIEKPASSPSDVVDTTVEKAMGGAEEESEGADGTS